MEAFTAATMSVATLISLAVAFCVLAVFLWLGLHIARHVLTAYRAFRGVVRDKLPSAGHE